MAQHTDDTALQASKARSEPLRRKRGGGGRAGEGTGSSVVAEIQAAGASSLQEIAAGLNARGISTAQGGQWSAMPVKRVMERI